MKIEDIDKAVALRTKLIDAENLLHEVIENDERVGRHYLRIAAGEGSPVTVSGRAISETTWMNIVQAIKTDLASQVDQYAAEIEAL